MGNSPQCDNSTLHTTTGPAILNARWSANTIILNWQPGDDATFTAPVQGNAAYSCEYDGGITLPTAQTRSGYTFGGWQVRAQSCLAQHYQAGYATGDGYINDRINASDPRSINTAQYDLTEDNTWALQFTEGVLKGRAICTNIPPSGVETIMTDINNGTITEEEGISMLYGNNGGGIVPYDTFSNSSTGKSCWCAVTDFGNSCHVVSPSWVFLTEEETSIRCANYCAAYCMEACGGDVNDVPGFRQAIFGVTE